MLLSNYQPELPKNIYSICRRVRLVSDSMGQQTFGALSKRRIVKETIQDRHVRVHVYVQHPCDIISKRVVNVTSKTGTTFWINLENVSRVHLPIDDKAYLLHNFAVVMCTWYILNR